MRFERSTVRRVADRTDKLDPAPHTEQDAFVSEAQQMRANAVTQGGRRRRWRDPIDRFPVAYGAQKRTSGAARSGMEPSTPTPPSSAPVGCFSVGWGEGLVAGGAVGRRRSSGPGRLVRVGGGVARMWTCAEPARTKVSSPPLDPRGAQDMCRPAGPEARTPRDSGGGLDMAHFARRRLRAVMLGGRPGRWSGPARAAVPDATDANEGQISDRFACITTRSMAQKPRSGRSTAGGWGTAQPPAA
jgi:hypothetical protein